MQLAIYEEASGTIVSLMQVSSFPQGMPDDFVPEGHAYTMMDDETEISIAGHCFINGVLSEKEPDLAPHRAALWSQAKAFRDFVSDGGCPTPLGVVQTDAESRLKISGAVQMAMLAQAASQPFEVSWTMKDNSTVRHSAAQTIQLGLTVGQHVNKAFEAATALRGRIEAAETLEALEAINILEAQWPPNE